MHLALIAVLRESLDDLALVLVAIITSSDENPMESVCYRVSESTVELA